MRVAVAPHRPPRPDGGHGARFGVKNRLGNALRDAAENVAGAVSPAVPAERCAKDKPDAPAQKMNVASDLLVLTSATFEKASATAHRSRSMKARWIWCCWRSRVAAASCNGTAGPRQQERRGSCIVVMYGATHAEGSRPCQQESIAKRDRSSSVSTSRRTRSPSASFVQRRSCPTPRWSGTTRSRSAA